MNVVLLVKKLQSKDWNERWQAAAELGKINDSEAIKSLNQALENEDPFTRSHAMMALQTLQVRDYAVIDAMEKIAAQDPEEYVRTIAQSILRTLRV